MRVAHTLDMAEQRRIVADDESALWVRGGHFVPEEQIGDDQRAPGRRYETYARVVRVDGLPQVDLLVITGSGIDARALRATSTRRDLALAGQFTEAQLRQRTTKEKRQVANANRKLIELLDTLADMWTPAEIPATRGPLTRPDGTDPDGFSRRVAAAYREAVATSSTPAKVLAEEAAVPVTTVHRWIRDARRAGHIPPTKKGARG